MQLERRVRLRLEVLLARLLRRDLVRRHERLRGMLDPLEYAWSEVHRV
jgi:hypothetical protein